MDIPRLACKTCGQEFELTPEYLAEYGGQTTACQCGSELQIPAAQAQPPAALAYASPAKASAKIPNNAWRDGRFLLMARGVRLPNRCAHCGVPVDRKFRTRTLLQASNAALSLEGLLLRKFMSDGVQVRFGYCREHMPWRMSEGARITLITCALAVPGLMGGAALVEKHYFYLFWTLLILAMVTMVSAIWIFFLEKPIKIENLDLKLVQLSGFGDGYLQHFEPVEQARDRASSKAASRLNAMDDGHG